ncbi:MAG: pseudouridine-5'-phosphate glycosidase [Acidimicrobiales bacterium]|nr:pseudouridine-5'-phosphate glycosidase [Acidimicrobiales bacterium]
MESPLVISDEVRQATADGRGVVALESTIFSNLGLPSPANQEALIRCIGAIEDAGAVPALTAVLDGVPRVGLAPAEHERILGPATKLAERDLGVAMAQGWAVGATTVSASAALAAGAGVAVFATGGIGGVHRGNAVSGDVSADLGAIARHPVTTVCAGAKSFLDLGKTVEQLETLGVPVLGYGTDTFPAFYGRSSGIPVPHRVDGPEEVAAIVAARRSVQPSAGGVLVAVPIPEADALPQVELDEALDAALAAAARDGLTGAAITPFVLAHMAQVTEGRSVPANLALAENNASVAAQIATELAGR